MTLNAIAVTRPVNPAGATPVLSAEQVWEGLNIKARQPSSFAPAITHCEVVSDSGDKVTRKVRMGTNPRLYDEEVLLFASTIAYFELDSGTRITNVLSYGPAGELLLTFSFANGIPGAPQGSAVEVAEPIGNVIETTLARIRALVTEGTIKAQ